MYNEHFKKYLYSKIFLEDSKIINSEHYMRADLAGEKTMKDYFLSITLAFKNYLNYN